MKVYISIPITNKDESVQRETAKFYKRHFERIGYEAINPFDLGDKLDQLHKEQNRPKPTWQQYMDIDLPEVQACTAIFMCNGWENSLGCLQELKTAIDLNLKVILESQIYSLQ